MTWYTAQMLINFGQFAISMGLWLQIRLLRTSTQHETDLIVTHVDKWCVKRSPAEVDTGD